ncbi:TonB-dependent receptor plug domain-containing protein [Pedobacter sp. AW1-32]|uniref:TonB-dependent receptor plug domain-containing protein n=1 Tax=Pedobacter sp. AW1-32 TaxID=3383026 RepID=UPI003FEF6A43
MKKYLLVLLLNLSVAAIGVAQNQGSIKGFIKSENADMIFGLTVFLKGTQYKTETDKNGAYNIIAPAGNYELIVSGVGYERRHAQITLIAGKVLVKDFTVKEGDRQNLADVKITGRNALKEVRESPYNVVALDARALHNSTLDLAHALNQVSGVRIRESGGVGSDMSITLNGFSGPHVKVFMDGMPMESFSSAFQLNNIPVTIAERIEVYKGVVPIQFGTDALGGVINIVTNQMPNYLDASYSIGSFNTHKSNVNFGITTRKGLSVQVNAFQNYSDNNYPVYVPILNTNTGNWGDSQWVNRFNGAYNNETIMAKVGVVKKSWADRIMIGLMLGQERAEIQNSAVMQIAFGKRERQANTFAPSIEYAKKNLFFDGLDLSINANYNRNYNQNIDTAARQYSWNGTYRTTGTVGESVNTLAEFFNNNTSATGNLNYRLGDTHLFTINNVFTGYRRTNTDAAALVATPAENSLTQSLKNILGASYTYKKDDKFNLIAFGKFYYQKINGQVDQNQTAGAGSVFIPVDAVTRNLGYGLAGTYFLHDIQLKASFEKTYRLPTQTELFGDQVTEIGNAGLTPERSYNVNLGASYKRKFNRDHAVYFDATLYYRDIAGYIRRTVMNGSIPTGSYTNHGYVTNLGIDAELRYYYKKWFMFGITGTYQEMLDKEQYYTSNSTQLSVTYGDRMPNIPYLFGSADAAFYFHNVGGKGNRLTLGYSLNYIAEFTLLSSGLGATGKSFVPEQLYHDVNLTYSLKNGRYNIAIEARDITDVMLYDNFSLQKPGRSFSLKLRYFISKFNTK